MNRVWTEEELEILRRDRAAKVPVPVTAAKLGRPVPATYARARLIGTLVQPHQPWDEASVARLRELVSADPPMTDKRIAEALGRTVTQIRWKMQDLELIGVRDLSKLAKITASGTATRPAKLLPQKSGLPTRSVAKKSLSVPGAAPQAQGRNLVNRAYPAPAYHPRAALERVLKDLETTLAERLKTFVSEAEAGMVRAATDAIAEKRRIDKRLAELGKRIVDAQADRIARVAPMKVQAKAADVHVPSQRRAHQAAPLVREHEPSSNEPNPTPTRSLSKSLARKPVIPAAQVVSQAASPRQTQPSAPPPKILVVEAPAAIRAEPSPSSDPVQVSGRGGWKSVRRDPARVAAQAKAKATSRADAVDLAQAAQAAINRFIAERGVTKTERRGVQALVSRLQARGYIVVQDGDGWVIDQRHRVENETALIAFAEARGISDNMAA